MHNTCQLQPNVSFLLPVNGYVIWNFIYITASHIEHSEKKLWHLHSSILSALAGCCYISMSLNALTILKYVISTTILPQQLPPFPRNYCEFGPYYRGVVAVTAGLLWPPSTCSSLFNNIQLHTDFSLMSIHFIFLQRKHAVHGITYYSALYSTEIQLKLKYELWCFTSENHCEYAVHTSSLVIALVQYMLHRCLKASFMVHKASTTVALLIEMVSYC